MKITDPADIENLPPGTILRDRHGAAWKRGTGSWVSTGEDGDPHDGVPLPALVLYHPAPAYAVGTRTREEEVMPDPMIDLAAALLAAHELLPGAPRVICRCSWEPEWGRDAHGFWIEQYDRHRAEALSHAGLLIWPPPICQRCHKPVTTTRVTTPEWAESRHCADCLNSPEVPE